MKRRLLSSISILLVLCTITNVAALTIGYSFEHIPTATVSMDAGDSKEYGSFTASGSHLRAQTNVTNSSGSVQIAYTAYKKNLLIYSSLGTQVINIGSPGWVGGTWSNSSKNTVKFKYKLNSGSVTNMQVRMYDY
jgi:hypothetical protein